MTDRNPTFAEALLACSIKAQNWWSGEADIDWTTAISRAEVILGKGGQCEGRNAPPEIRRALGADKQPDTEFDGLPMGHMISMLSDAKAGRPISKADADAMGGWINSHALGVDKPHGDGGEWWEREERSRSKIAALESQLAAAVARAEKAEAQAAEARDAFTLAVGERDSLRAKLDKAKADVMAANLRARTAQDERDALRAELDKAKAAVAAMEASRDGWCEKATKPPQCEVERPDLETVWTYGDFGWHGAGGLPYCRERAARAETIRIYARALERKAKAREARLAELDRFDVLGMTGRLDTALRERDALAAKLAEAEKRTMMGTWVTWEHHSEVVDGVARQRDALRAERDRLAGILDRAGKNLEEVHDAARKALDAKEQP